MRIDGRSSLSKTTRRPGAVRVLGLCVVAATVALPDRAQAHQQVPQRAVTLQMDDKGLAAFWQVEIGGSEAALLRGMHDVDRDGELSSAEGERLAGVVLARMVSDVKWSVEGEPLPYSSLRASLAEYTTTGRIKVLGLGVLPFPSGQAWTLDVLSTRGPLEIVVQGRDGWRTDTQPKPRQIAAGKVLTVHMRHGDSR